MSYSMDSATQAKPSARPGKRRRMRGWVLAVVLAALVVWSGEQTGFSLGAIFGGLGTGFRFLATDMLPPKLSVLPSLIGPILDTIYIGFVAMAVGAVVSSFAAIFSAETTAPHPAVRHVARALTSFVRNIPVAIWTILLVAGYGLGNLVGVLALILATSGWLTRAFAEVLEEIDMGQVESLKAAGASYTQVLARGVLPQFLPGFFGWSLYMLESNVRASTIIGMVGGGGIGFQIQKSIKLFQYTSVSSAVLLVVLLVLGTEWVSNRIRSRIYQPVRRSGDSSSGPAKDWVLRSALAVGVLFFFWSAYELHLQYSRLWTGTSRLFHVVGLMFPPDFSAWHDVLGSALESLQVAIMGTVLGIAGAFLLSFVAAGNTTPHPIFAAAVRFAASLIRSIPILIWVLLLIVSVGMGPLPGVLAIGIHAAAMLIKSYAQSMEDVDGGVIEAMKATGAGWFSVNLRGVLLNALPSFIAWSVFYLEANVIESTILGTVGAGGIGWQLSDAMRGYQFGKALFVIIVISVMVFSIEMISNRLKLQLNKRRH